MNTVYRWKRGRVEGNPLCGPLVFFDHTKGGKYSSALFLRDLELTINSDLVSVKGLQENWKYHSMYFNNIEDADSVDDSFLEVIKPGRIGRWFGVKEFSRVMEGWVRLKELTPYYREFINVPIRIVLANKTTAETDKP